MNSKISSWGNSYAIRIPKILLDSLNLKEDDQILIEKYKDGLMIMPKKKSFSLTELTSRISKTNIHTEIDTGEALGNEAW